MYIDFYEKIITTKSISDHILFSGRSRHWPRVTVSSVILGIISSDASISRLRHRYDIDTILTKYQDRDIDI